MAEVREADSRPARDRRGAELALRERGTSLLPVGVVEVEGEFEAGDAVEVRCDGRAVGKGIVNYSAAELRRIKGMKKTEAVREVLPRATEEPSTGTTSSWSNADAPLPVRQGDPEPRPARARRAAAVLYLLADTAMVGHLGTEELAALAIAATLLAGTFTLFNFLTYGTTAQVARHGAGDELGAGRLAQSLWLSAGIGVALTALLAALAEPLVELMGGDGRVGELAVDYLRIGSLGLPFALICAQGFLRGVSDLRAPLVIVVVANAANVVLNVVFIYELDWGLNGSAAATVVAQAGMGAAFVRALCPRPPTRGGPSLARMHWPASAVRSSCGRPRYTGRSWWRARCWPGSGQTRSAPIRSPSSCSSSWRSCSMLIAIAGQVIVGRTLGAGDAGADAAARPG